MTIRYIEHVEIGDVNMAVTTGAFVEASEPVYSGASTYDIGDKVKHGYYNEVGGFVSFRIYSSKQNSNTGNTPPAGLLEDDWWVLHSVDSRYAYRDYGFGKESYTTDSIVDIEITSGPTDMDVIQLINVTAEVWFAYDETDTLFDGGNLAIGSNSEATRRKNLTIDIPPANQGASYRIRLQRTTSSQIKLAQVIVGYARELEGDLQYGLSLDAEDFSVNSFNEFGNVQLLQRAFVKRLSASVVIPNDYFNQYHRVFAARRAMNTVWILTEEADYNETVIFGTGRCSLLANYETNSIAQIDIKGSI